MATETGGQGRETSLLWIGAGRGLDLERRAAGAARLVLVEPEARAARALARRLAGRPGAEVVAAALGGPEAAGRAALHLFSDPAHNSLRPPGPRLAELLPGLRPLGVQEVALLSPAALVAGLSAALPQPWRLIIEAPGAERDILEGFRAAGLLEAVDRVDLRAPARALHPGAAGAEELALWLDAADFRPEAGHGTGPGDPAAGDPDWPERRFRRDGLRSGLRRDLARAETRAEAAEAALGRERELAAGLGAEVERLGAELAALSRREAGILDGIRRAAAQIDMANALIRKETP